MTIPATFADTYAVVASPADANETVIATLAGVSTQLPGQTIKLKGWANVTAGASTTGVILRVRKDSLTGTLLGAAAGVGIAAAQISAGVNASVDASDPGENVSGAVYVLTATCTAAGAAATVNAVHLEARID